MRTFLVFLLVAAVSCSDLPSYSPARGEFPVQSGVAQAYVRYVDANGAERLIGYAYPEPLLGVRRVNVASYDASNPLLKTAPQTTQPTRSETQAQTHTQTQLQMEKQFRDWCEERYLMLKAEIQRLRAEGKQPNGAIANQLNTLQSIVLQGGGGAGAGAALLVPLESVETKRAREQQLQQWNDQRLRVLQLQSDHSQRRDEETIGTRPIVSATEGLQQYQSETAEQAKAREEHLRIYNEQLQLLQQPLVLQTPAEQAQQRDELQQVAGNRPIIGILAVKTVLSNHGQQMHISQQQEAIKDTPEVVRAREEHLRLVSEAQMKATTANEGGADTNEPAHSSAEARELELERQREAERQREDERMRELEHQQELARLQAEQRQMEAERLAEIKRIQQEEGAAAIKDTTIDTTVPALQQQPQQQQFNVRFLAEPVGVGGVRGGEVVKPVVVPSNVAYYAPAAGYAGVVNAPNPFLARYAPVEDPKPLPVATNIVKPAALGDLKSPIASSASSSSSSSSTSSSLSSSSSSDSTVVVSSSEATPKYDAAATLAALEKARQEHFRAHEIALEQLRLVSIRDAKHYDTSKDTTTNDSNKDC